MSILTISSQKEFAEKQNVNKARYSSDIDVLLEEYKDEIYKNNEIDIKLYNYFYDNFQKEVAEDDRLVRELSAFGESNSRFRFNRLKKKMLHRLKRVYFQKLELLYRDTSKRKLSI